MIAIMAAHEEKSHHSSMTKFLTVLVLSACGHAWAQHHPAHTPPGGAVPAPTSVYAGEETREIKALSAQEQRAWLDGHGAGLARAAELNGYPGPMHTLEHASELGLSPSQVKETQELMDRHKAEVRALGAQLVEAERHLDALFRTRQATPAEVSRQTLQIATLQAQIRASHLTTHLSQAKILQPEQITAYLRVRGYKR